MVETCAKRNEAEDRLYGIRELNTNNMHGISDADVETCGYFMCEPEHYLQNKNARNNGDFPCCVFCLKLL